MKILQLTLLVADYMNMMGKTAPGLLPRTSSELNLYELLNIKQTNVVFDSIFRNRWNYNSKLSNSLYEES